MKKLFTIFTIALLAGCSSTQPQQVSYQPKAPEVESVAGAESVAFTLTSKDLRTAQYVGLYRVNDDRSMPIHPRQNVRIALDSELSSLFSDLGYTLTPNGENSVKIEILELLANVSPGSFTSTTSAKMAVQLTAESPQGKFVKTYRGEANLEGSGVDEDKVASVLNRVSNVVLETIANDIELQTYLEKQF